MRYTVITLPEGKIAIANETLKEMPNNINVYSIRYKSVIRCTEVENSYFNECYEIVASTYFIDKGIPMWEIEISYWETVPVRWIKWTKRQPSWNGSVYLQYNGKNQSSGMVNNKQLIKLSDVDTEYHFGEDGKVIADYSAQQLEMIQSVYWLEQLNDEVEFVEGIGFSIKGQAHLSKEDSIEFETTTSDPYEDSYEGDWQTTEVLLTYEELGQTWCTVKQRYHETQKQTV